MAYSVSKLMDCNRNTQEITRGSITGTGVGGGGTLVDVIGPTLTKYSFSASGVQAGGATSAALFLDPMTGFNIGVVLCRLTLLLLAGAASWLYGMTPPPDSPNVGAPGACLFAIPGQRGQQSERRADAEVSAAARAEVFAGGLGTRKQRAQLTLEPDAVPRRLPPRPEEGIAPNDGGVAAGLQAPEPTDVGFLYDMEGTAPVLTAEALASVTRRDPVLRRGSGCRGGPVGGAWKGCRCRQRRSRGGRAVVCLPI